WAGASLLRCMPSIWLAWPNSPIQSINLIVALGLETALDEKSSIAILLIANDRKCIQVHLTDSAQPTSEVAFPVGAPQPHSLPPNSGMPFSCRPLRPLLAQLETARQPACTCARSLARR
ncbi:MAG: hypothetical protein ACLGIY_03790, partial [Betaproteobacteria bacterium]